MKYPLNNSWRLNFCDPTKGNTEISAQVPGNVIGDLFRAGMIPDPYIGMNSLLLRPYEFIDWEYSTDFPTPAHEASEQIELCFNGIDTVFELYINGQNAGHGCNMFIEHRFDITMLLRPAGERNELRLKIVSSVNFAKKVHRPAAFDCPAYNFEGWHLRRATHTYGWDIAPRLVGAGIWRSVFLEVTGRTRWRDFYLYTQWVNDEWVGTVLHWEFNTDTINFDGFRAELFLTCGDSHYQESFPLRFVSGRNYFQWKNPRLWWPRGSGAPNLYETSLKLFYNNILCDERQWRTGLRDIRLEHNETNFDGEGKFCFKVNHRPIFIKGANWVPANALHGERAERISQNLKLFSELDCNMVRCWGGGVYEDHDFFDFCDRQGLLVWQDFMLACSMPPQDDEFLRQLETEAVSVIRKLRRHPSLALWCGDNEGDQRFFAVAERRNPSMNPATRNILPKVVFAHDPGRDYLPSSPFLCDELKKRNARYASPEQHLWGSRDTWKNPFYNNDRIIFASEIGYLGMPSATSTGKFIDIKGKDVFATDDPVWLCHATQPFADSHGCYAYRLGQMRNQIEWFWGKAADDLETISEESQIVQAEAMKYFIENFRMRKWKKTGIIWWNVIDCWPQFSESVVDYDLNRKLAFFYIKNVQQSVLLMFDEPGNWAIRLHGVNDLDREIRVRYQVTDIVDGKLELAGEALLASDSTREIAVMKINSSSQRILRIDYEYEGRKAINHALLGNPPFSYSLYQKWLATAKMEYR